MNRQPLQHAVGQVEHLAVDEVERAALGEALELAGQLRAGGQRDDDARRLQRIAARRALGDLIVELVILDAFASDAGLFPLALANVPRCESHITADAEHQQ